MAVALDIGLEYFFQFPGGLLGGLDQLRLIMVDSLLAL